MMWHPVFRTDTAATIICQYDFASLRSNGNRDWKIAVSVVFVFSTVACFRTSIRWRLLWFSRYHSLWPQNTYIHLWDEESVRALDVLGIFGFVERTVSCEDNTLNNGFRHWYYSIISCLPRDNVQCQSQNMTKKQEMKTTAKALKCDTPNRFQRKNNLLKTTRPFLSSVKQRLSPPLLSISNEASNKHPLFIEKACL